MCVLLLLYTSRNIYFYLNGTVLLCGVILHTNQLSPNFLTVTNLSLVYIQSRRIQSNADDVRKGCVKTELSLDTYKFAHARVFISALTSKDGQSHENTYSFGTTDRRLGCIIPWCCGAHPAACLVHDTASEVSAHPHNFGLLGNNTIIHGSQPNIVSA